LVTSLSSLTPGSFEHTQLLSDITTDFGTELTAGGYSLDTLVSSSLSVIQGGGDLCSAVPNFELPADKLTAAAEKAVESKQPTVDSAEEKTSTLWENPDVVAQKAELGVKVQKMIPEPSTDVDVVADTVTSTTPPTEDTGAYKVATKTSNVTTTKGVKVEVTTPEDSITSTKTITKLDESTSIKTQTTITSGGGVKTSEKANISSAGLTSRPVRITEYFTEDDVSGFAFDEITLKYVPLEILGVSGRDERREPTAAWRRLGTADKRFAGKRYDIYELDGYKITIYDTVYEYEQMSEERANKKHGGIRYIYKVRYKYLDTYDPRFTND